MRLSICGNSNVCHVYHSLQDIHVCTFHCTRFESLTLKMTIRDVDDLYENWLTNVICQDVYVRKICTKTDVRTKVATVAEVSTFKRQKWSHSKYLFQMNFQLLKIRVYNIRQIYRFQNANRQYIFDTVILKVSFRRCINVQNEEKHENSVYVFSRIKVVIYTKYCYSIKIVWNAINIYEKTRQF